MAVHLEIGSTPTIFLVTTAETVVASWVFGQAAPMLVSGVINASMGAGATQVVFRLRQGIGITGTVVGIPDAMAVTASSGVQIPFEKEDPIGALSYSITLQQFGATGNGQVNDASIDFDQNLAGKP